MKKTLYFLTIVFTLIILLACSNVESNDNNKNNDENDDHNNKYPEIDEELLNDDVKPTITIIESEKTIIINKGEEYNLLEGVVGFDNLELDITEKIVISDDGFDFNVPGTYYIIYFLSDIAGNAADSVERRIIVLDNELLNEFPIYNNQIVNEAPKPGPQSIFQGAWYHKVESSKDLWKGIEGTITVPSVDINRYNPEHNANLDLAIDPHARNLDTSSIYMGGLAQSESDVGLSLSLVLLNVGPDEYISTGAYAFRPFWRYITPTEKDLGHYDLVGGRRYAVSNAGSSNNMYGHWYYGDTEYYYLPGDKLRIIVYSPEENYLQLQVEVIEKSTLESTIKIREENNWEDPKNFFSPIFRAPGHGGSGLTTYKRVNAIDQSGNEGKPIIETTTEIKNAIWESVYLHREINGNLFRVPLNENRSSSLSSPRSEHFTVSSIDNLTGGTTITIHPGYKREKK